MTPDRAARPWRAPRSGRLQAGSMGDIPAIGSSCEPEASLSLPYRRGVCSRRVTRSSGGRGTKQRPEGSRCVLIANTDSSRTAAEEFNRGVGHSGAQLMRNQQFRTSYGSLDGRDCPCFVRELQPTPAHRNQLAGMKNPKTVGSCRLESVPVAEYASLLISGSAVRVRGGPLVKSTTYRSSHA